MCFCEKKLKQLKQSQLLSPKEKNDFWTISTVESAVIYRLKE